MSGEHLQSPATAELADLELVDRALAAIDTIGPPPDGDFAGAQIRTLDQERSLWSFQEKIQRGMRAGLEQQARTGETKKLRAIAKKALVDAEALRASAEKTG